MYKKAVWEVVVDKNGQHKQDCGSASVQVAFLLTKVKILSTHLKNHPHDITTKRVLLKKVAQRQRLLKYIANKKTAY